MQIMQEHLSVNHMEVVNADYAGAFICELLWNQEFVLEFVIQLFCQDKACPQLTKLARKVSINFIIPVAV